MKGGDQEEGDDIFQVRNDSLCSTANDQFGVKTMGTQSGRDDLFGSRRRCRIVGGMSGMDLSGTADQRGALTLPRCTVMYLYVAASEISHVKYL